MLARKGSLRRACGAPLRPARRSAEQITATGDTVNVASRLMEVAAQNGADVALSGDLYRAASERLPATGKLQGPIQSLIRGRSGTMTAWLWREA